jgi:uncharacterized phage-associated protein
MTSKFDFIKQMYYNLKGSIREIFRREEKMNRFLDVEKALEAVVYVSHKTNDLFHIVKILYYADKIHLEEYGRQLTGDYYVAMEEGPVPSGAYDLIKRARGDEQLFEARIVDIHPEKSISIKDHIIVTPLRPTKLEFLSESDIECLDKSIEVYATMGVKKLWELAHEEEAYKKARRNGPIQLSDIIQSLPSGNEILEYLNS